jgi:hypothetical protein
VCEAAGGLGSGAAVVAVVPVAALAAVLAASAVTVGGSRSAIGR